MSYIITYKGKKFDYLNPTEDMIDLDDVFRALPRLNRFVGHSRRSYSVGEHTFLCLVMSELLGFSYREQLLVFVHDFTETYVGDCPAPLKRLLPEFSVIESRVEDLIYKKIGISPPTEEEYRKIKGIDMTMLVIEMRDLTEHTHETFINELTYTDVLEHEELQLTHNNGINEDILEQLLKECFYDLVERVREEEMDVQV